MVISDLHANQSCTLRLYRGDSDNLFNATVWNRSDGVGFSVDPDCIEVVLMLMQLEYDKDLIVIEDSKPVCFEHIQVCPVEGGWQFTTDMIGRHKDRRVWPRHSYTRPGVIELPNKSIPTVIQLTDVSRHGLGFTTTERLPLDTIGSCVFKSPELDKVMKLQVTLLHGQQSGTVRKYGCYVESDALQPLTEALQNKHLSEVNS